MSADAGSDGGILPDPEEAFRRRCCRDRARLDGLREQLAMADAGLPAAVLASLQEISHGLYGAGGTFGFDDISAAADALELMVESLRGEGRREWLEQRTLVMQAMMKLLEALGDMRRRPC